MIQIEQQVVRQMIDHALRDFPLEACGLLGGCDGGSRFYLPCVNELRSPTAFSIPPEQLFDGFRRFRTLGLQLSGIFHSHPRGSLIPSLRDSREFHYRAVSYWIVSLQNGEASVGCFEWADHRFVAVPYVTF